MPIVFSLDNPQARDLSSLGKISEKTVLKIVKCKLVNRRKIEKVRKKKEDL